ncbi:sensor histidine kinase [Flavobacterium sp.]|uniref:sensor histidine kinase n=1 Tax=Flavobacterium sp. TaxID=239 RepID=UPI003D13E2C2
MKLQELIKNRGLKHLFFWMFYLLATSFAVFSKVEKFCFAEILGYQASELFFGMIMAYWVSYYLLSEKFLKKGILISGCFFLLTIYVLSAMSRLTMVHVMEPIFRTPPFEQEPLLEILTDLKALFMRYTPGILTTALIFYIVKYFSDYNTLNAQKLQLEKEKTQSELKMLRAQLNPHFLFNTLNNIYSLSLDNSPKTSSSIGKLSEILDYVLYKCDTNLVPISSEMKLIEDYIELEKLRYDDRLKVTISQSIERDLPVPPLLLLSLVENAFKHGAGEDSGSPKIEIEILTTDFQMEFKIANTCIENDSPVHKDAIGLTNVKKQLDLLFAHRYTLEIVKGNGWFRVNLILKNA